MEPGELVRTLEEGNGAVLQERNQILQEKEQAILSGDRVIRSRARLLAKLRELGVGPEKL